MHRERELESNYDIIFVAFCVLTNWHIKDQSIVK